MDHNINRYRHRHHINVHNHCYNETQVDKYQSSISQNNIVLIKKTVTLLVLTRGTPTVRLSSRDCTTDLTLSPCQYASWKFVNFTSGPFYLRGEAGRQFFHRHQSIGSNQRRGKTEATLIFIGSGDRRQESKSSWAETDRVLMVADNF